MPKILIVEDNPFDIEITSELLKNAGYDILVGQNAHEGIFLAEQNEPDLILMDINLPDISGIEATKILRNSSITKDIPIIAHTVCVLPNETQDIYMAGCTGIITKPIDVSDFIQTVQRYLEIGTKPQNVSCYHAQEQTIKSSYSSFLPSEKPFKEHKVLIIDDNQINAELLNAAMEQIDKDTKIAYSGRHAVDIINNEKFDLILLDIMMPEMSGFEVIEKVKDSINQNTPVVFISALNETKDIVKGLNLGSYDYITKPYNVEELQARVQGILRTKDLQDKLRYEQEKWDKINKYSADGVIMLDSDLKIISCNKKVGEYLEKTEQEIIGHSFCLFFKLNDKDCNCYDISALKECLSKKPNVMKDFIFEKQERKIYFEINCSKINLPEKHEYIFILRDITKEKEIEQQKETFIATLTHDLKTPVRAEIMSMQMLLKEKFGQLNPQQVEIVQEILNSSKFMFRMIDTLLAKYKYDYGKIKLHRENVDMREIIKSCISEIKHIADEKKQELIIDMNLLDIPFSADTIEIKRLISNLLSNAINYTPEYGKIIINTRQSGNEFRLSVTDTGLGISEEKIGTLFDKYISYAKTFRSVGTGLGLYVVKQIAQAHGGEILVESKVGHGSTFTFILPQENLVLAN